MSPADAPGAGDALTECRQSLAELEDRHRRVAADLDNVRKRARREVEQRVRREREELVREWLEVVDNLERAVAEGAGAPAAALHAGMEAVLRQARELLEARGVRRMESVGAPFDPELHEAVGEVHPQDERAGDRREGGGRRVASEVRAGYESEGSVVRPARVIVTKDGG